MELFVCWSPENETYDVKKEDGECIFYGDAWQVDAWLEENAQPTDNPLLWNQ